MILLFHPQSTKPRSRRHPLSVLSLAAVLEGKEDYVIIDGNVDSAPKQTLALYLARGNVDILAVSVMPGPQMVAAVNACRFVRENFPSVKIVWGGYFPSLYCDTTLNANYVDFAVRGQGEDTLPELLEALRSGSGFELIPGLSYKRPEGTHCHNSERSLKNPEAYPWPPFHRLNPDHYILPTFLGRRTAVHQASIGCPYPCTFCGVISAFGSREKMEAPQRTADILSLLKHRYGVDSVQFYDNNFFLAEDHAVQVCDKLAPLHLNWWCEARIDILLRYSDTTLRAIRNSGCRMIFFGAESGSDWVLKEMNKHLSTHQTLDLAKRIQDFDIVPEFSFVVGNPKDPERDMRECLKFIRRIKDINPSSEIILQHYVPVPQRDGMYGDVDDKVTFPTTPDEWATPHWLNFTMRKDPAVSWLPHRIKQRIDDFELVVNSRWPTIQDIRLPDWGRRLLPALSSWRYKFQIYSYPWELAWAHRFIDLRKPKWESL